MGVNRRGKIPFNLTNEAWVLVSLTYDWVKNLASFQKHLETKTKYKVSKW